MPTTVPWASVEQICRVQAYRLLERTRHRPVVDQDDLQQAALLAVAERYPCDDTGVHLPDGDTTGMLATIAYRRAVDALRAVIPGYRPIPPQASPPPAVVRLDALDDDMLTSDPFSGIDDWLAIKDQLAALPERQAFVLAARAHGYTLREIAARLGIDASRVHQIERAARAALADAPMSLAEVA